jgi:Glycosyl transferase family 11
VTTVGFPMLGRWGRLGNQCWQVASTIGIARSGGDDPIFPADWAYREWFSLPDEMYSPDPPDVDVTDLARALSPADPTYLQDFGLWRAYMLEIDDLLTPNEHANAVAAERHPEFFDLTAPILSVHVRRGDNAHDPATPDKHLYHPLRPISYYAEGILMRRHHSASIAVFSDDPDWCIENLPGCDYYHRGVVRPKENEPGYDDPPMDWVDLLLMTLCSHHVISNSTFGWWGAWLSGDPAPIYSWPWYGPALAHEPAHLMFPSSWRRIPVNLDEVGR